MISKTLGKFNLLILYAVISFALASWFHSHSSKPVPEIKKQDSAMNMNENFFKLFSLGNRRLISDLIWIKTLLETDMERYTHRDLGNWLYLRFITVSELDPNFYENYQFGGMFLSIVKDDLEGAADLYERGLRVFPSDFKLNYQAGFNYYYEMGDFKKGLNLLKKVEHHPDASPLVKFLIQKLQFETGGNFDIPIAFIKINLDNTKDPDLRKKLLAELYALNAERDLKCLNGGAKECNYKDIEGQLYRYKNSTWVAPKEFSLYRVHRQKSVIERNFKSQSIKEPK